MNCRSRLLEMLPLLVLSLAPSACQDSSPASPGDAGPAVQRPGERPYLVDYSISVPPEGTALLMQLMPAMPSGPLDRSQAIEVIGGGSARVFGNWVFVTNGEDMSIQRFDASAGTLTPGPKISFAGRGLVYLYEVVVVSATKAITVNDGLDQLIEWNPTDMTITKVHDLSSVRREGWGHEWRQTFYRDDGKLFLYFTYTNKRVTTLDNFNVAVFDVNSGAITMLEDARCGATAGFGGHFDEQGDLYLFADNFGMYTRLRDGGKKSACLLRIRKGETTIDPNYLFQFQSVLGPDRDAWGSWYGGNGVVYTSPIDLTRAGAYDNAIKLILEKIHPYARVDTVAGTVTPVPDMPLDGVGFQPSLLGGKLYVPRTTGTVVVNDIEQDSTRVYEIDPASNTSRVAFSIPGFLGRVVQLP